MSRVLVLQGAIATREHAGVVTVERFDPSPAVWQEWRLGAAEETDSMTRFAYALIAVVALGNAVSLTADDKKEVKLTGTLVCGKCQLKQTAKCSNVLQVKEGDKVVNYFLDDKGNGESYHEGVCGGDRVENVAVAGTVAEKDGKKTVKPTKVEPSKK